jgi:hypothetical protein
LLKLLHLQTPAIPLKAYTKFALRCLLTDPAVDVNALPRGFTPMNVKTFDKQVLPLFETRKEELGRLTITAYKKMRTLPLRLVRVVLDDAGLTTYNA